MSRINNIVKSIFGICETKPLHPDLWHREGDRVCIKLKQIPDLQHAGGAYYLKGQGLKKPILVVKAENDHYFAFENRCTHIGRKIDPVPGEYKLRCCSVNHSTFDYDGKNISGPAKYPLKKYDVTQNEKELVIQL